MMLCSDNFDLIVFVLSWIGLVGWEAHAEDLV
jgi:hypothetical protein